jgi:hypothetical protein
VGEEQDGVLRNSLDGLLTFCLKGKKLYFINLSLPSDKNISSAGYAAYAALIINAVIITQFRHFVPDFLANT